MLNPVRVQNSVGDRVLFAQSGNKPTSELENLFVKTFDVEELSRPSLISSANHPYRILHRFDEFNQGHHSEALICMEPGGNIKAVKISNYDIDPNSEEVRNPESIKTKQLVKMKTAEEQERAFALRSILEARFSFPHPYAVCAKESGFVKQDNVENIFIIMDFINGMSIKDLVKILHSFEFNEGYSPKGDLPENDDVGYKRAYTRDILRSTREDLVKTVERESIRACVSAAECLEALAKEGYAHRDIKPSNIVLASEDGSVKAYVIDFGIHYDPYRVNDFVPTLGKQAYLTPERHITGEINKTTDFFAFSAIIWRMLTGLNLLKDNDYVPILESDRNLKKEFPRLFNLLEDSFKENPKKRPSPEEYVTRLKEAVRVEFK